MARRCAMLLALLVALTLVADPAVSSPRRTTESTLNIYRANPSWMIRADVAASMGRADVIRVQEVYPAKARRAVQAVVDNRPNWVGASRMARTELAILWDTRIWRRVGHGHVRWASAAKPGGDYSRWIGWQALARRGTDRVVTIANVHPSPGACRPNPAPWRVQYVTKHWQRVREWTARQQRLHPDRVILLGGDFNCRLEQRARPWYPGRVLAHQYRFDHTGSIDRLITSRGFAYPVAVRRWGVPAHSDHNAQYRALRWLGK
jgi:hypothetical protein